MYVILLFNPTTIKGISFISPQNMYFSVSDVITGMLAIERWVNTDMCWFYAVIKHRWHCMTDLVALFLLHKHDQVRHETQN